MSLPGLLNGTTREHYILLFGAAGCIALLAGVIGAWIGGYLGARRAMGTALLSAPQNTVNLQLAPIIQALDAISLEVERISEAQRFTTRILSERQPVVLPRVDQRSITPH
ncbi:MAG: hypothetical protein ABIT20_17480 [Gemmatimonadaceae bacterium]